MTTQRTELGGSSQYGATVGAKAGGGGGLAVSQGRVVSRILRIARDNHLQMTIHTVDSTAAAGVPGRDAKGVGSRPCMAKPADRTGVGVGAGGGGGGGVYGQ